METQPIIMEAKCQSFMKGIGSLRYEVWSQESETFGRIFPLGIWLEPSDIDAKHFVVICDGKIVAAARVTLHTTLSDIPDFSLYGEVKNKFRYPMASFNRLVVKKEYRNRGFAGMLIRARLAYAKSNASGVVCIGHGSQGERLKRFGFSGHGIAEKYNSIYKTFPEESTIMYHDLKGDSYSGVLFSMNEEKHLTA